MGPDCPPEILDDIAGDRPAWPALLVLIALAGATWCAYTAIYNLYFHPLSRFPGPRAAAVTGYWKAWVECVLEKSFCHELEVLHARNGKVVRVGPNEVGLLAPTHLAAIWDTPHKHSISRVKACPKSEIQYRFTNTSKSLAGEGTVSHQVKPS